MADFDTNIKDAIEEFYFKMESRINELANQLKETVIPSTVEKLKGNIFKTIFFSFLLGFIFGFLVFLFGFRTKDKGKRK